LKIDVYSITHIESGKQYIGITNNLKRRWTCHRSVVNKNTYIANAIRKYGVNAFEFKHIATAFDEDSAIQIERLLIADRKTLCPDGYNLGLGGEGKPGHVNTKETREKISKGNKGLVKFPNGYPEEGRKKLSAIKKGVKRLPEHVEKSKIARKLSFERKMMDPEYSNRFRTSKVKNAKMA